MRESLIRKRYAAGFSHSPASHLTPIAFPRDFTFGWRKSIIGNYYLPNWCGKEPCKALKSKPFPSLAVRLPIVNHNGIEGAKSGHEKSPSIVPLPLRRDTPSLLRLASRL